MKKWLGIGAGLLVLIVGGLQIAGAVTLGSCDSSTALDTVRDIIDDQTGQAVELTNVAEASSTDEEKRCTAHVVSGDISEDITYRVYWNGWSKMVEVNPAA